VSDPQPPAQPPAPTGLSPTATAAEIAAELDMVAGEIELARTLAGEGHMLELGGIDARVEVACRAAQALPPAEAQELVERLGHLVALLDRLAAELLHQFGNLPKDAETPPQVAAGAYGKTAGGQG
jgi:hypothetical protein